MFSPSPTNPSAPDAAKIDSILPAVFAPHIDESAAFAETIEDGVELRDRSVRIGFEQRVGVVDPYVLERLRVTPRETRFGFRLDAAER
jgi:hypothetical protein